MKVKLNLEIDLGNSAFEQNPAAEVERIMSKYNILAILGEATKYELGAIERCYLRDINGNTCGEYTVALEE